MIKNCLICENTFKTANWDAKRKYCSKKCSTLGLKVPPKEKLCPYCKSEFFPPEDNPRKKYCSSLCHRNSQKERLWVWSDESKKRVSMWANFTKDQKLEHMKKSFERKVIKNETGCWGWKGALRSGYGFVSCGNNKTITSSRFSWILHNGPIPEKLHVLHHCDNPTCVKTTHLFLGTPQDNVDDMMRKKRNNPPKGIDAGNVKLTEKEVYEIRKLLHNKESANSIAKKYGRGPSTIVKIRDRITWKHLKESDELQ